MESKIEIRRVRPEDIEKIAEIEKISHPDPWSEKMFERELCLDFSNIFAAFYKNKIAGYVCFWNVENEAQLSNITVAGKLRRNGIGSKLVRHAIECAESLGDKKMFLEVRADNAGALKFYEKFGFKKIDVRKKYYSNSADAVIMEKTL